MCTFKMKLTLFFHTCISFHPILAIDLNSIIQIIPKNSKTHASSTKFANSQLRGIGRGESGKNSHQEYVLREDLIDLSQITSISNGKSRIPDDLNVQLFHDELSILFERKLDRWNMNKTSYYWYGESNQSDTFHIEVNDQDCIGYVHDAREITI